MKNQFLISLMVASIVGCSQLSKKKEQGSVNKSKKISEVAPELTRPKVKKIWVKDKVIGNRYIKGYWEYIIKENSEWSK